MTIIIVFLLILGIAGIVNFVIEHYKESLRWWDYCFLGISVLLVAQSLCAFLCPEILNVIYE